jgi:hypothetical protein
LLPVTEERQAWPGREEGDDTVTTENDNSLQESTPLTPEQERAMALLLFGASDQKVADHVGRHRVTVTKWRLYDPVFREEFRRRRRELWNGSVDSLRALLPSAITTLHDQLHSAPNRGRLALDLLAKAGLMGKPYSGALAETDDPTTTPNPAPPATPEGADPPGQAQ